MNKTVALVGFLAIVPQTALAVVWIGESKRDPITDQPYSLAWMESDDGKSSVGFRCRRGQFDIFWQTGPRLKIKRRLSKITFRIGAGTPGETVGVTDGDGIIALDVKPLREPSTDVMRGQRIVLRTTDDSDNEVTSVFTSGLLPNSLTLVGRVLSDCGITDFPSSEIEAAHRALDAPPKAQRPKR